MKSVYVACLLFYAGMCCANGETDSHQLILKKIGNDNTTDDEDAGVYSRERKATIDNDSNKIVKVVESQQSTPQESPKDYEMNRKNHRAPKESSIQSCLPHVSTKGMRNKLRRLWHRRHRKPRLAYRMAVMAAISYWEFHKWSLPENVTGFRLKTYSVANELQLRLCWIRRFVSKEAILDILRKSDPVTHTLYSYENFTMNMKNETVTSCKHQPYPTKKSGYKKKDRQRFTFEYFLYDWRERVAGVSWHDTDILVGTSDDGNTLAIAFAGTSSAADAITNLQTFELNNHSSFFFDNVKNQTVHGSVHRGFLNAYSRVDRGSALRLCPNCTSNGSSNSLIESLHKRFGHCTADAKTQKLKKDKAQKLTEKSRVDNHDGYDHDSKPPEGVTIADDGEELDVGIRRLSEYKPENVRETRNGGCHSRGEKLVTILRELATEALQSGKTVHITGHSLGGGLSTLMALDLIINLIEIPVSKLHLWTFGAPQVADDIFLRSAMQVSPRLQKFVLESGNGRFHRFVTLSDDCQVDVVSELTARTLTSHKQNFRGRTVRRLGGVRGDLVHFAEPHLLLTPDQYATGALSSNVTSDNAKGGQNTRSSVAAHSIVNYLQGISRESREHPLQSDLPPILAEYIGK